MERISSLLKGPGLISSPFDYYCLTAPDEWRVVNAIPVRRMLLDKPEDTRNLVMSLRVGTGIMGDLDCPSGDSDYVPKGHNEVILGVGLQGIEALLQLGAMPCISCHSGDRLARLAPVALETTLGSSLSNAGNRNFLIPRYDARRLDWPKILTARVSPNRFYTRPGLEMSEVKAISELFEKVDLPTPAIGYYDKSRVDRFFRYT